MHLEHRRLLEFAADAERRDLRLVELGQIVAALEEHVAVVGARLAGDDVHHGGLAGAVRPDDGAHLAGLDRERKVVQRAEAVERHGDAVEIEQGRGAGFAMVYSAACGAGGVVCRSGARRAARAIHHRQVPTTPRGSSSVTATNSPPSMNSQYGASGPEVNVVLA